MTKFPRKFNSSLPAETWLHASYDGRGKHVDYRSLAKRALMALLWGLACFCAGAWAATYVAS